MQFDFAPFSTVLHGALVAAGAFLAGKVCGLVNHAIASIHNQQIRQWAETLVQAAESQATAPTTGLQKKEWVVSHLKALFPKLSPEMASDLVEGIVQGIKASAPKSA